MNEYEALFIIKPDLKDIDAASALKMITDTLAKNKAEIIKEEPWGKRQMTYKVKKFREGLYHKVDFKSPAEGISKLREAYALNPDILRVTIIKR